ncbi:hypothetical protein F5B22DRAFT_498194 [Xylaria bambusicola]|uniref:uncharacterized protein n=1 Tax=Xylaria bambusicola TaxID=326684 RepID=UPI00200855F0|nr:uncharacterized protein F5B22DRAFT_498194 [Xylaria bambusicola]KAI0505678.1 hypothetical protein F5B22DRAFT_498194 [Xylaria bambusicola]
MEESRRLAELQVQLRNLENCPKQAEKRRREEHQRVGRARKCRREEEQRADKAKAQCLPTTLDEYIEACHNLVFTNLKVKPGPARMTTGSILPPYAKFYPRRLRPWDDFLDEQHKILEKVYLNFPIGKQVFDNRNYLATLGQKVIKGPLTNKKVLETILHKCIEDPVRCIIHELSKSGDFQKVLNIGHGIAFENQINPLDDRSYEVVNRQLQPTAQPQEPEQVTKPLKTPNPAKYPPTLNPDQICVYRCEEQGTEKRKTIAIWEYKPPHELSLTQLRAGLRDLDMRKVVTNDKIPKDEEAKFRHYATKLVALAITQAFHHMVKSGLAYGLLTTGEGIVFLKIDWNDPHTVYYHLAEPAEEVAAHNNSYRSCSAISQYLGFYLLALSDYSDRGQDARDRAISGLKTWTTDFRTAASEVPENQRMPPQYSPAYTPNVYLSVDRTMPYQSLRFQCNGAQYSNPPLLGGNKDDSIEGEGVRSPNRRKSPGTVTERQATRRSARLLGRHSNNREGAGREGQTRGRGSRHSDGNEFEGKPYKDLAYCTQKCFLGLVMGDVLDPDCPNLTLHQHRNTYGSVLCIDNYHCISHSDFLQLLSHQLQRTLDYGISSLGITATRGALFKVTLLAYGYTFVGKGTVQAFIPDLEHEAQVYERLKDIQGVHIPVFLGAINLRALNRTYYYDFRVDIVHLSLLSWGGLSLRDGLGLGKNKPTLQRMTVETIKEIHQRRVVHNDTHYENILFNPQTGRVMLIDFERSQLLDMPRPTPDARKPNKRRRAQDSKEQTKSVDSSCNFSDDLAGVDGAFYIISLPGYQQKSHVGQR